MKSHRPCFLLDGKWQLWTDREDTYTHEALGSSPDYIVDVPSPIQAQSDDLRLYTGTVWYRRQFELPEDWTTGSIYVGFDAVDYRAEVWLNGVLLGEHDGGYLPFEMDATQAVKPEINTLIVRVTDPPEWFAEIPHGKQSWYGPLSGIWQNVWIERREACFIQVLDIRPSVDNKTIACRLVLSSPAPEDAHLLPALTLPDGDSMDLDLVDFAAGGSSIDWVITLQDIRLWSTTAPNLYRLSVKLELQGRSTDIVSESFGFRKIETREGRLYLNGEPVYLRGALDQDYYPGTICTPPSRAFIEDEMRKARQLGLNCLRVHIKIPDPVYYEVADELGMLVWTELPSFSVLTTRSAALAWQTLEGILSRDRHHPSIIAWTIINENWGLDLPGDPWHRQWLAETYAWLKELDPTRLVVDNSACSVNFHVHSDLDDYHHYRAMPDHQQQWLEFIDDFASRPDWTFSKHGDAVRSGNEPLILSEFGNWGLPDANLLRDKNGQDPWWFDTGSDWGGGWVYPHGVQSRFHTLGFDRIFESWESFIAATQWYQYQALKFEIETMRLRPAIQGYVITELTDVHWECNGLMDMDRRIKVFGSQLAKINADIIVSAGLERTAWRADETIPVAFYVSHGAGETYQDCRLHWKAAAWGAEGFIPVAEISSGQVISLGKAIIPATSMERSSRETVTFELLDGKGEKIASNSLELSLFPPRAAESFKSTMVWCPEINLADYLQKAGYTMAASPQTAQVLVACQADRDLLALVNEGSHLLLLVEDSTGLHPEIFGLGVEDASNKDWITSFGWLRREGVFSNIPGGPLIDDSFEPVIPELNLTGFGLSYFQASPGGGAAVFSGQFLGWVHRPSAWIGRRPYGRGMVVVSTYRLRGADKTANPLAATLLDDLISLTAQIGHAFSSHGDG